MGSLIGGSTTSTAPGSSETLAAEFHPAGSRAWETYVVQTPLSSVQTRSQNAGYLTPNTPSTTLSTTASYGIQWPGYSSSRGSGSTTELSDATDIFPTSFRFDHLPTFTAIRIRGTFYWPGVALVANVQRLQLFTISGSEDAISYPGVVPDQYSFRMALDHSWDGQSDTRTLKVPTSTSAFASVANSAGGASVQGFATYDVVIRSTGITWSLSMVPVINVAASTFSGTSTQNLWQYQRLSIGASVYSAGSDGGNARTWAGGLGAFRVTVF